MRFSTIPAINPLPSPRLRRGLILRQIGDGTYLPVVSPGRPTTVSPRRHPIYRAAAETSEACLIAYLERREQMLAYDEVTVEEWRKLRLRMAAAEAARLEQRRIAEEEAMERAATRARLEASEAKLRAEKAKEDRRLSRQERREYNARVKAVGPLRKDPMQWKPKELEPQDDPLRSTAQPEAWADESPPFPVIPQPSWLPDPVW